jgi:hypothetical protein
VRLEGKAHVSGKLREVWLRTAHSSQLLPVVPKYNSELRFSGTEGTTVTDYRVPGVAFTPKSLNETDEVRSRDCWGRTAGYHLFGVIKAPVQDPMLSLFLPVITFSKNARSARFSEAGAIVRSSLPCFPRKLPCFRPNNRETGSYMTACTTIHALKLYATRDTRKSSASMSANFLATAVSARAFKANEASLGSRLCAKKFRSWLEGQRLVR